MFIAVRERVSLTANMNTDRHLKTPAVIIISPTKLLEDTV